MDDINPIAVDWERELFGLNLDRTIQFARLRCLPREQVIERALNLENDDNSDAYIYRLGELDLTPFELGRLADAMSELARRTENASPRIKTRIDKILLRLLRLLSPDLAARFAEPYIDHPRKTRRKWAYATLRDKPISETIGAKLVKVFCERGDKAVLPFIIRSPECVQAVGADVLLEYFDAKDENHWRGRVLQAQLIYDRPAAIVLSRQYPWEFVYAAGRSEEKSLTSTVCSLFEANANNGKFLSIYAWALGKLRAKEELDALDRFVRAIRANRPPAM